jgi:hypothetical protein
MVGTGVPAIARVSMRRKIPAGRETANKIETDKNREAGPGKD